MLSLLETLLAFVGVILVLALAAESLQELVKAGLALKGQATLRGLRGLIGEAVQSRGLINSGDDIYQGVVRRLQGLGQDGVRPSALRLDKLTASQLADLLRNLNPAEISDLRTMQHKNAEAELGQLAERAERWFPMAMDPVADRYRRRMRGVAFVSSAAVVLALNANALTIFQRARDDDQFRQRVSAATASDSLNQSAIRVAADTSFLAGMTGDREPEKLDWWIGILLSTFLVSLGGPFWHDALESLFGIKNRIRAEAKKIEETTLPVEFERQAGPEGVRVVARQADEALVP